MDFSKIKLYSVALPEAGFMKPETVIRIGDALALREHILRVDEVAREVVQIHPSAPGIDRLERALNDRPLDAELASTMVRVIREVVRLNELRTAIDSKSATVGMIKDYEDKKVKTWARAAALLNSLPQEPAAE